MVQGLSYADMQKIVTQTGLLIFFLSVIYFSRMGQPLKDILLKSSLLFVVFTISAAVLVLIFLKYSERISPDQNEEYESESKGKHR
jgi:hypothetical protein